MNLLSTISNDTTVQLAVVIGFVVIVLMIIVARSVAQGRRQELAKSQLGFEQNMAVKRFDRELTALPAPVQQRMPE